MQKRRRTCDTYKIIDGVRSYIREQEMIRPGEHIFAGVSGGADSLCLLLILSELKEELSFSLEAVHVEHGIRGEESLEDAAFTENFCKELGVPCQVYHVDVPGLAAREKLTVEEAARKCRYAAFEDACGLDGKIAVAHNRDDQAETILWNLARGTGLKGLGGMRPVNKKIIRPLLELSRQEIESFLKEQGIFYRTDSTNLSDDYTRNRVRHQILPAMEEGMNSQTKRHIAQAGSRIRKVQEYMEGQAKKRFEELALPQEGEQAEKGVLRIHANGFCQEPEVMQEYILWICLEELSMGLKDLGAVHLEDLRRLAKNQSGREIHLPDGRRVSRQGDALVFEKAGKTAKEEELGREDVTLPIPGRIRWGGYQITATLEPYKKQIIPQKKCTKWLDYGRIKGKIQVRRRRSGDYFFADGGHKKLKKYFIDEKIPRQERDQIPLLAEEDHILWIVGHRISDGCKVSERTEMLLKVQITEEEEDGR